jgi:hypothetical protein
VRLGRRRFSLLALFTALFGREAVSASASAAETDTVAVLTEVAHSLFPHDGLSSAHYRDAAAAFVASSSSQGERLAVAVGAVEFLAGTPSLRSERLRRIEQTPDFQVFRFHVLMMTYNDLSVTQAFGYQGPSLAQGGYLSRGFDDIDWLPSPVRDAD